MIAITHIWPMLTIVYIQVNLHTDLYVVGFAFLFYCLWADEEDGCLCGEQSV